MDNNSLSENQYVSQYIEEIDNIMSIIRKIGSFFSLYDGKTEYKNIYLEKEFQLTKLNLKYLDTIISGILGNMTQIKMLKLYDYIIYEFKRLRIKYEEMDTDYFTLDEENKYITNIKIFLDNKEKIHFGKIGYLYLKMNLNNLSRMYELLVFISGKNFKINDYTEEYKKSVNI
jgi:hypothetical protein